jgi:ribosomal protein S18 acetylase RimI-like enzyme
MIRAVESLSVRVAASVSDVEAIERIDRSFVTERIYRLRTRQLAWRLEEHILATPLEKTAPLPKPKLTDRLFVCCVGEEIVGFGLLEFERWNGRARVQQLFVSPSHRGRGAGRALVDALDARAREEPDMRCLWLETQNVNYPAIQFYRRLGFRLCGFDETLYRPEWGTEVGLFFARKIA